MSCNPCLDTNCGESGNRINHRGRVQMIFGFVHQQYGPVVAGCDIRMNERGYLHENALTVGQACRCGIPT